MTKFHVNPDTGMTNACHADKQDCRFGEALHGETRAEAQTAYEKSQAAENIPEAVKSHKLNRKLDYPYRGTTVSAVVKNIIKDYEATTDDPYNLTEQFAYDFTGMENNSVYIEEQYVVTPSRIHEDSAETANKYNDDDKLLMIRIESEDLPKITSQYGKNVFDKADSRYELVDPYGESYDDDIVSDKYENFVYVLDSEQKEMLEKAQAKEDLEYSYKTAKDATLPDWAALPIQVNHRVNTNLTRLNRDRYSNGYIEKIKILQKKLDNVDNNVKKVNIVNRKLKKLSQDNETLEKSKEGLPTVVTQAIDTKIFQNRDAAEKLTYDLKSYETSADKTKFEEELEKTERLYNQHRKQLYEQNREPYIQALAEHHYSNDYDERVEAAKQWYNSHKNINMDWQNDF